MSTATFEYATLDELELKAMRLSDVEYAVMTHDLDTGSNHYHLCVYFKDAKTIKAVSKLLDIPENFIAKWDKRVYNMWAYLLHDTTEAKNNNADYTE